MINFNLIKPKRPFKNIEEFRRHIAAYGKRKLFENNASLYPCIDCDAKGWIYDPDDPPCRIEGNKMRDKIKCLRCAGSSVMLGKDFRVAYKELIEQWKKEIIKWKKFQLILKSAKKKMAILTKAEKDALGYY